MANINWDAPEAQAAFKEIYAKNTSLTPEQMQKGISEAIDAGKLDANRFGAGTPAPTTPAPTAPAPTAPAPAPAAPAPNSMVDAIPVEGMAPAQETTGDMLPSGFSAMEVGKAAPIIQGTANKLSGVGLDGIKAGIKKVAPKIIPAVTKGASTLAKGAGKVAGPLVAGAVSAAETYGDAKSGKLKQTGEYLPDAGRAFVSYMDSVLFNSLEGISKSMGKKPFWENTPEDQKKIIDNYKMLKAAEPNVEAWKGVPVERTKEAMADSNAIATTKAKMLQKIRHSGYPDYTLEQLDKQFQYNPKTKSFEKK